MKNIRANLTESVIMLSKAKRQDSLDWPMFAQSLKTRACIRSMHSVKKTYEIIIPLPPVKFNTDNFSAVLWNCNEYMILKPLIIFSNNFLKGTIIKFTK